MFNVGVIGSKSAPRLVKLTGRMSGDVFIHADGRHFSGNPTQEQLGEWYRPGKTAGIGAAYSVRYSLQAGAHPSGENNSISTSWQTISLDLVLDFGESRGRVLIEIRDNATSTVQAAAQFWADPIYAP